MQLVDYIYRTIVKKNHYQKYVRLLFSKKVLLFFEFLFQSFMQKNNPECSPGSCICCLEKCHNYLFTNPISGKVGMFSEILQQLKSVLF